MNLKGERQLQARLKAIGRTDTLMKAIVIRGVREAKLLVPRKTGNLGRSIRPGTVTKTRGEIKAGGVRLVGYAAYVELGTRGGQRIVPRKAKVLAWGGARTLSGRLRSGSRPTHFAMSVKRGATKAQPYLRPGLQKAATQGGIDAIVELWNGAA